VKAPKWTPPINGWQYPIVDDCNVAKLPTTLKLYRTINGHWYGQFLGSRERLIPLVQTNGSLAFCCRVLSAALRGGK
jgi:hypothetical protein